MGGQIGWTEDSKGFYFGAPYTSHPVYVNASVEHLYYYDVGAGKTTQVPLDWENGLAGGFTVAPDGILVLLANGARTKAAIYSRSADTRSGDTSTRTWLDGDHATNMASTEAIAAA